MVTISLVPSACFRPAVAEVSCCSPVPLFLHLPVGVSARPPTLVLPDQSDGRTGWWCKWARTSLCVFLCMRGGSFKPLSCCVFFFFRVLQYFLDRHILLYKNISHPFLFSPCKPVKTLKKCAYWEWGVFPHRSPWLSLHRNKKLFSFLFSLPCCANRIKPDLPPVVALRLKYSLPWKPVWNNNN